jgi:hypothetical protein
MPSPPSEPSPSPPSEQHLIPDESNSPEPTASPEPVASAAPPTQPDTSPAETLERSPSPSHSPAAASPPPGRATAEKEKISYHGVWTLTDAQGQSFDMVIFPNGQVVTNWAKGSEGARGERGYWRQDHERFTAIYSDGATDIIEWDESGFRHRRYAAGSPLDSQPAAQGEAQRVEGNQSAMLGVWRLNKEPDGSHLYIAIQSGGRAISTINGATEGKWTANERGVLCEWPDGWVDQIERGAAGWQKRSWIGPESSAPADLSLATRVGETRFSVEP